MITGKAASQQFYNNKKPIVEKNGSSTWGAMNDHELETGPQSQRKCDLDRVAEGGRCPKVFSTSREGGKSEFTDSS